MDALLGEMQPGAAPVSPIADSPRVPVNRLAAEAAAVADGRVVWDETTSVLSHGDHLTAGMRAAVLPAGAALLELAAEEWLSQWIDNEGREAR